MRRKLVPTIGLFLLAAGATPVLAHAFLDHAVPGVGATVRAAPGELQLTFTQQVVVALAKVTIARAGGGAVAAGKAVGAGGSSSDTLRVRLSQPLSPGAYSVTWQVVSIDTHSTSGTYPFTVAP